MSLGIPAALLLYAARRDDRTELGREIQFPEAQRGIGMNRAVCSASALKSTVVEWQYNIDGVPRLLSPKSQPVCPHPVSVRLTRLPTPPQTLSRSLLPRCVIPC